MTKVLVVSDFNAALLSRYLEAGVEAPGCAVETTPFDQLFQSLAGFVGGVDVTTVVWARPEAISSRWARLLEGEYVSDADLEADVDAFIGLLKQVAGRSRQLLVVSLVQSRVGRGLGMLDWSRTGFSRRLASLNIRLAQGLDDIANAAVLDAQRWIEAARPARDSTYGHSIKSPFGEGVFKAAAQDVRAAMRAAAGRARKLLILDLDHTVWGGIVGDDGWENLRIGGHDAEGEAHLDLQKAALSLSRRGIALGIVSKNDEQVALTAIDSHPSMLLRRTNLAGWRINWRDKAANIVELVAELNLGLDAAVFIDDNPTERGRVREALPEVLVPELSANPASYADVLRNLDCFDQISLTAEDQRRADMYVAERTRRDSVADFSSAAEWLSSLDIRVAIGVYGEANAKRVVQLLNKTNQLNLATRRLTEGELESWLAGGSGRGLRTVSVVDRFGDLGLTGILSWERNDDVLEIVDFVLSCRAMGREVERAMAHFAWSAARSAGTARLVARYKPTPRNRPTLDFFQGSGFLTTLEGVFEWSVIDEYPCPAPVRLGGEGEGLDAG